MATFAKKLFPTDGKFATQRQAFTTGIARRLGLDLRALALYRLALGALVIASVYMLIGDVEAFYTDFGVLPVGPYVSEFANRSHISLHLASGTLAWQVFLLCLQTLAGLGLMLGYRTKTSNLISWILLISLHNRNPLVLNGGDVLLRLLLFWGLFLPLGRRWSIDAALSEPEVEHAQNAKENLLLSGGSIALTMQVVYVYLTTAILKSGLEWWPQGTASYFALSLDSFVTSFGLWLRQWHELLQYGTYAVYFLELFGPFLLFSPVFFVPIRTAIIMAFIALHINFELTMRLGLFPWVDMTILLALFPGEIFDRLESSWSRIPRLTLYYNETCHFCKKFVYLLREAYLVKETIILPTSHQTFTRTPSQPESSWIVVDANNDQHVRWDACVITLEHMPILHSFWRLLPLRRLRPLGNRIYGLIAKRQSQLVWLTDKYLRWHPPPSINASLTSNIAALFLTTYVGLWNLKTIPDSGITISDSWDKIATYLRLDQKWNMFAPFPLKEDGWYVIDGTLNDGTKVDVLSGELGQVSFEKPELVAYTKYKNARWRKYLLTISSKKRKAHRRHYGKYLCRQWNRDVFDDPKKLKAFQIFFVKEYSTPVGEEPKLTQNSLWRHHCFTTSENLEPNSNTTSRTENQNTDPAISTDSNQQSGDDHNSSP